MDTRLTSAIGAALDADVTSHASVSGGDINDAYRVSLSDGRRVFVKTHATAPGRMFATEAMGISWLGDAGALRVPEVLAVGSDTKPAFLVLELIEPGRPTRDFDETLGRGLAALHRCQPEGFGLDHDNFIGRLPQSNRPTPDWPSFYRERRLQPQLRAAVDSGHVDPGTEARVDRLLAELDGLVGATELPARLHGDLWGGNLHTGEQGEPVLIDPAVYGGHREMDLAMMRLFGGFGARVFAAYAEAHPLAPGHERRVALYQLYPVLVHVNLFGGSYVGSLRRCLDSLGF